MTLAPNTQIGAYRVDALIARGAMAEVYRAYDTRLDRTVALKAMRVDARDPEMSGRFMREAQVLARIEDTHVADVYDFGTTGVTLDGVAVDMLWLAMRYIDGTSLGDMLSDGPLDESTALALCAQAASGLTAAHAHDVVHRDVKPDNLVVDTTGKLTVIDFGIAWIEPTRADAFRTSAGVAVGTPHFMAPEQARGGKVDGRADIYSLGATLYALLSGVPPHHVDHADRNSDVDVLARLLATQPTPLVSRNPRVSASTLALVEHLMAREPADRPHDMAQVAMRLREQTARVSRDLATSTSPELATAAPSATHAIAALSPGARKVLPFALGLTLLAAIAVWQVPALNGAAVAPSRDDEPTDGMSTDGEALGTPTAATSVPSAPAPAPAIVVATPTPVPPSDVALFLDTPTVTAAAKLLQRPGAATDGELMDIAVRDSLAGASLRQAIGESRALEAWPLLEYALVNGSPAVATDAIDVLLQLKTDRAVEVLSHAEASHSNKDIRKRAKDARAQLFSAD